MTSGALRAELPQEVETSGISIWRAVGITRILLTQLIIVTQKVLLIRSSYHWIKQQWSAMSDRRDQFNSNQQDLIARLADVEARLDQAGIASLDV